MHPAAVALAALVLAGAAFATPADNTTWAGRWVAEPHGLYGNRTFVLRQRGEAVTGRFGWSFRAEHGFGSPACFTGTGGTLAGRASGRRLNARLTYPRRGGHARSVATLNATLSANGRMITGRGRILSGECAGLFWGFEASRPA